MPPSTTIRRIQWFLSISLCFLWTVSCTNRDQVSANGSFTGKYLAHLQLDSTILVATELISGLEVPWDITYGSDGWIWINEQRGIVSRVNTETGEHQVLLEIPDVHFERSRGLLSKTIHPDFNEHPHLFFHYVYSDEEGNHSRIVRYTFEEDSLVDRTIILDPLPGSTGHNGSRMMIGPDGKLWLGTGDAHRGDLAQNPDTYHGKVLRMNLDGSIPEDNPFGNRVWSTGHRNIQGITSGNDRIYISEHGPDNDDEVNLILKGRNYGWPDVQGNCDSEIERQYCRDSLIVEPLVAFNPVVAPAGIDYYGHEAIPEWKNSLLLTSLRIQTLRILHLDETGENVDDIQIFFQQHFGRLRDVAVDSQGRVFLATSNTDWYREARPEIHDPALAEHGDRIIMLQKADASLLARFENVENKQALNEDRIPLYLGDSEIADDMGASERLYMTHCASCHRPDGTGMEGLAPSLVNNDSISGSRITLINLLLNGVPPEHQSDIYEWNMPVYRNLSNDEIAAILNFVRSEFSSERGHFMPDDIEDIRVSVK